MAICRTSGGGRHILSGLTALAILCLGLAKSSDKGKASDPLEDDLTDAVAELRTRVKEEARQHSMGVLLVTNEHEHAWNQLTIPIWRAYCEHHNVGFFVQKQTLNAQHERDWAKPRTLMELLPATTWKYVFMVDAQSLPVDFNKSWTYAIRQHMRHKRFKNDETHERLIYCPQDCEDEYVDSFMEGACYGPILTGCIFAAKKKQTTKLVSYWYSRRGDLENATKEQAVTKAWQKMKEQDWQKVFMHDIQDDIGKRTSKFLAHFEYDSKKHGWNLRDQIYDFIHAHPDLARIANQTFEESRSDEL